ncbi:MAG: hypothetical protein GYA48_08550 [Chloroflexi bacterium]|nr:hypothetical protein [Chloroflexota bacterium]
MNHEHSFNTTHEENGLPLEAVVCTACSRAFLKPAGITADTCPQCSQGRLQPFSGPVRPEPPEKIIPFAISPAHLAARFTRFCEGVWLSAPDFSPQHLAQRALPLYFPLWLVDATAQGSWQAETGFDYQVQSTKEIFSDGEWHTQPIQETRVRWEPRLGQISRSYQNVAVNALTDQPQLSTALGQYELGQAIDFNPAHLSSAWLRCPDVLPEQAWPQAEMRLRQVLQSDCQAACSAQHIRNFSVTADYSNQNWTQLLAPAYITYYTSDDNQKILVALNAQSGHLYGPRLASQKRGWKVAGILGGIGLGIVLLAILFFLFAAVFPPISVVASILLVAGLLLVAGAAIPAAYPWLWNRGQMELRVFRLKDSS